MSNLTFIAEPVDPDSESCTGSVYRYTLYWYRDNENHLHERHSFKYQKRLSCPGCKRCGPIHDDLSERGYEFSRPDDLRSGDFCELRMTNMHRDWESGHLDDWDLEMCRLTLEEVEQIKQIRKGNKREQRTPHSTDR